MNIIKAAWLEGFNISTDTNKEHYLVRAVYGANLSPMIYDPKKNTLLLLSLPTDLGIAKGQ